MSLQLPQSSFHWIHFSYPTARKLTRNYTLADGIAVPIIKTATRGLRLLAYSWAVVRRQPLRQLLTLPPYRWTSGPHAGGAGQPWHIIRNTSHK